MENKKKGHSSKQTMAIMHFANNYFLIYIYIYIYIYIHTHYTNIHTKSLPINKLKIYLPSIESENYLIYKHFEVKIYCTKRHFFYS